MSDGGYSRLEKDFLGNERMVHYDGSGNMIGASDVVREPDGTIRIPNETTAAEPAAKTGTPVDPNAHLPKDAGAGIRSRQNVSTGRTITYVFAAFIGAMLLTLAALNAFVSQGRRTPVRETFSPAETPSQPAPTYRNDTIPERRPERQDDLPSDPKPRNDEVPDEPKPFDQTAPDMNSGDDQHPKIDDGNSVEPSKTDQDKGKGKSQSDDPIDLRGDGEGKKTSPPTTDPNDIH